MEEKVEGHTIESPKIQVHIVVFFSLTLPCRLIFESSHWKIHLHRTPTSLWFDWFTHLNAGQRREG